jgi:hypothetical protein
LAEEKKGFYNMLGEFCREAGVLIFVFGNLDIWLHPQTTDTRKIFTLFLQATSVGLVFLIIGMILEKWRE